MYLHKVNLSNLTNLSLIQNIQKKNIEHIDPLTINDSLFLYLRFLINITIVLYNM